MKRNLDLIREMLIEASETNYPLDANVFTSKHHSEREILYNIDLMAQAGLIEAHITKDANKDILEASICNITWEGNEFLSSIQSESTWAEVKKRIAKTVQDVPLSIVKKLAIDIATHLLGI